jgi:hypothetical protein
VRWAIDGFGTFKAAGEDGIFPGLLQHGIEIIIGHITKIVAACLAYGYIPLAWRTVRVIFIPKPGRDSYELANSFRPISLTSFFLKTMERLDSYIRAGPWKFFPLMESQYAYQRGRSTEAALHDLVQKIEGSLNQKEFALGVFLDIDGAFDNSSFGSMDAVSGEHGVVLTLRRWIDAMLRCRSVRVEISGSSYASLVWWRRVEKKNAQKSLSHLQWMTCLGITGGMHPTCPTPTSALEVMLMLPPLHLFIK